MTAVLLVVLVAAPGNWVEQPVFEHHARRSKWGQVELTFPVAPQAQALELRFAQRLDGVRVEVEGDDGAHRAIPLQPERRYGGTELTLEWQAVGIRRVTVRLHHHLRPAPVVVSWAVREVTH